MFLSSKLFIFFFLMAATSTILAEELLYTAFATIPWTQARAYKNLRGFKSYTNKLFTFDANNASMDYSSYTWMNPCYEDFYAAEKAEFVVFWLKGDFLYCESVADAMVSADLRFPEEYLMRTERIARRCPLSP